MAADGDVRGWTCGEVLPELVERSRAAFVRCRGGRRLRAREVLRLFGAREVLRPQHFPGLVNLGNPPEEFCTRAWK